MEIFTYIAQIGEKKENNGRQVVSDFNDIVFITGVLLLSGLGHGDLRSYLLQINKSERGQVNLDDFHL